MQASRLDDLFRDLKSGLLPLIKRIQASPNKPDRSFLAGRRFDVGKQTALNHRIARELGFDEVC